MEEAIRTITLCQIGIRILWVISAFWLGYEIGKQKVYTKLLEKDQEELRKYIKGKKGRI